MDWKLGCTNRPRSAKGEGPEWRCRVLSGARTGQPEGKGLQVGDAEATQGRGGGVRAVVGHQRSQDTEVIGRAIDLHGNVGREEARGWGGLHKGVKV